MKGGRCENCKGDGILKIEMQFLADVYVQCEVCKGKRYNREALEIHYKGRSIADVLEMTIEEAHEVFAAVPNVAAKLRVLSEVGLGYVHLGQPATTLSGGEAQRVKLATELSRRATGRTLYLLDEPTTGLHFADVEKLLQVLHRLVDQGNTVLVIEHNLDVIKTADWIVDLGPAGGFRGGRIVAEGTPEQVAEACGSATGEYLARVLRGEPLIPLSDVTFADEAGRGGARIGQRRSRGDPAADRAEPEARRRRSLRMTETAPAARPARHEVPTIDELALAAARAGDAVVAAAAERGSDRWTRELGTVPDLLRDGDLGDVRRAAIRARAAYGPKDSVRDALPADATEPFLGRDRPADPRAGPVRPGPLRTAPTPARVRASGLESDQASGRESDQASARPSGRASGPASVPQSVQASAPQSGRASDPASVQQSDPGWGREWARVSDPVTASGPASEPRSGPASASARRARWDPASARHRALGPGRPPAERRPRRVSARAPGRGHSCRRVRQPDRWVGQTCARRVRS